jgi:hypothetical protein
MDDFPIVERIRYGPGERGRDFLLFAACLIAPLFIFWVFPDQMAHLREQSYLLPHQGVMTDGYTPGEYASSSSRFVLWLFLLPIGCLYFLYVMLFKADQTYTISTDAISHEQRSLFKHTKLIWLVSDISDVQILSRTGVFTGDRYGAKPSESGFQIVIHFKVSEKFTLPVRRHYAHALRIKQAIESLVN